MSSYAGSSQTRREDRAQRARELRPEKPFVGVDGEGGDIEGSHEYLLLRAGSHVLETGQPLTADECFGFLADLPKDCIYVSYYFDYDVTMMIRRLPEERLRRLLDRETRFRSNGSTGPRGSDKSAPMPVDVGQFQIDYLAHKEFRVRRFLGRDSSGRRAYGKWTVISDVGTFFQCSFVSALRKWFGTTTDDGEWHPNPGESFMADVIEQIARGKDQRNTFGRVTSDEREYNLLEIRALERLMNKFRAMCFRAELRPSKWQGPGNLVMAQFRKVGLPRNKDVDCFDRYDGLLRMANAAYYGGRFEATSFGWIDGPIYQYDINSAYARTYRDLPCLLHGEWQPITDLPTDGIYVAHVRFNHHRKQALYGFPVRTKKGEILFPKQGQGTYWSPELSMARKVGCDVDVVAGWLYVSGRCQCRHFDWVEDLYAERKRLGKDGVGYVLKIMLATIYGKLAQSVGAAPYANPVWSGLIVSMVRAQLYAAALAQPEKGTGSDVLMLATDGLFTRTDRTGTLDIGDALGQWDVKIHDGMFIVQSGVYMLPEKAPKTRGVPQRKIVQHTWDFVTAWERYLTDDILPVVPVELRAFVGIRTAVARGRLDIAGQWLPQRREITFDWNTKRIRPRKVGTMVRTEAPLGSRDLVSMPYQRIIGGASFRALDDEQPDWSDAL